MKNKDNTKTNCYNCEVEYRTEGPQHSLQLKHSDHSDLKFMGTYLLHSRMRHNKSPKMSYFFPSSSQIICLCDSTIEVRGIIMFYNHWYRVITQQVGVNNKSTLLNYVNDGDVMNHI